MQKKIFIFIFILFCALSVNGQMAERHSPRCLTISGGGAIALPLYDNGEVAAIAVFLYTVMEVKFKIVPIKGKIPPKNAASKAKELWKKGFFYERRLIEKPLSEPLPRVPIEVALTSPGKLGEKEVITLFFPAPGGKPGQVFVVDVALDNKTIRVPGIIGLGFDSEKNIPKDLVKKSRVNEKGKRL